MSQHIEIEFKNLLTKDEFIELTTFLQFSTEDFKTQINHYFDTPSFSLKKQGCALRIREKSEHMELTLKQPAPTGLLETNQILTEREKQNMMQTGNLPKGPVFHILTEVLHPNESVSYFGSLTTKRAEKKYKDGLIVLDHSQYLNTEDFELEFEVEDEQIGLRNFQNILHQLQIPMRKTDNKMMRFYKQKQKEQENI